MCCILTKKGCASTQTLTDCSLNSHTKIDHKQMIISSLDTHRHTNLGLSDTAFQGQSVICPSVVQFRLGTDEAAPVTRHKNPKHINTDKGRGAGQSI